MKKHSIQSSPRILELKKKRQQAIIKKIVVCVVSLLVIGTVGTFITRFDRVNIKEVEIKGSKIIDQKEIKSIVEKDIEGYYLWIFPKSNFLLYPKDKIMSDLSNSFKRLQTIALTIDDTNTLVVTVSERVALYTWCGESMSDTEEKCYFLDQSGYVLDRAPYFSGDVYFRFYGLDDELEEVIDKPTGVYYFKDDFARLVKFKEGAEELDTDPVAMLVTKSGEIKMYLSPSSGLRYPEILLKSSLDFDEAIENLHTALDTEPLKTKFKKNYKELLYIDLRFGNKVYFKFAEQGALPVTGA